MPDIVLRTSAPVPYADIDKAARRQLIRLALRVQDDCSRDDADPEVVRAYFVAELELIQTARAFERPGEPKGA
jgi:hypothetical protein